jgi:hypothetical protein
LPVIWQEPGAPARVVQALPGVAPLQADRLQEPQSELAETVAGLLIELAATRQRTARSRRTLLFFMVSPLRSRAGAP